MNHEKPIEEANNQTTIMETHLNPSEGVPPAAPKYNSITLTTAEILDLAIAANLIPKALRTIEEELETEYTIFEISGGVLVYDDDKTPHIYGHGAYITEYPDEGTFALGAEIQSPTQSTPQPVEPAASGTPETDSQISPLNSEHVHVSFARDLEQRLRASEAESEERLQNAKRLHRNLVNATAERDAALTQTAAIQAQWDAAMGDLKTLEVERDAALAESKRWRNVAKSYDDSPSRKFHEEFKQLQERLERSELEHAHADREAGLALEQIKQLCIEHDAALARVAKMEGALRQIGWVNGGGIPKHDPQADIARTALQP